MTEKKKDKILTIIVCSLWTIYVPFSYYYTYGFVTFFIFFFFLIIALPLTVKLLIGLIKRAKAKKSYSFYLLTISLLVLLFNTFYSVGILEKLDWKYRYHERLSIIEKFKVGELKATDGRIKYNSLPPISNGGNEVFISKTPSGKVEAKFYIDRGFLDHYSAYIYTEREADIEAYERDMKDEGISKKVEKMAQNWYKVRD
ncbi:hypothetical protein [Rufibacter sp. LB8]|uniref:hypothetical protein n=1 Tax=Rufibacter sp. LB8 TaxID=2777781 RepID=UPI00178C67C3|nr:hypothetical protein [Rufibacter sp. LB8]